MEEQQQPENNNGDTTITSDSTPQVHQSSINTCCSKIVTWDELEDSNIPLDHPDHRFRNIYSIQMNLQQEESTDTDADTPIFNVKVSVTCQPRQESLVGEENLDRLIYSYLPESPVMAHLQATLGDSSAEEEDDETMLLLRNTLLDENGKVAHDRLQM